MATEGSNQVLTDEESATERKSWMRMKVIVSNMERKSENWDVLENWTHLKGADNRTPLRGSSGPKRRRRCRPRNHEGH